MGRSPRRRGRPPKTPYPKSRRRKTTPASPPPSPSPTPPSTSSSLRDCQYSSSRDRLSFILHSGTSYTISPADSSPEHFWGTIYSAEWSHPASLSDCTCAIKASDFVEGGDEKRAAYRRPRRDFEREVQTFLKTRHRNVLKMYDYWEWDGKGYIAMKKMKGSLGDILYEQEYAFIVNSIRTHEGVFAELVKQLLTGLEHLHSLGIIYRDLKPDNLLISSHPTMKLADFGNVHFLPNRNATVRGLEGTKSYMSPEMRMGRNYNTKTDIWSLGITLLNVLFFNDTDFPNFDETGPWAPRKFAQEQCYLSDESQDFMNSLFLKSSERPSAQELLQHPFIGKSEKRAFQKVMLAFPPQHLALPVLSHRVQPETPPATPRKSMSPNTPENYPVSDDPEFESRLTPPVTPSPPSKRRVISKRVTRQSVKQNAMQVRRTSPRLQRMKGQH